MSCLLWRCLPIRAEKREKAAGCISWRPFCVYCSIKSGEGRGKRMGIMPGTMGKKLRRWELIGWIVVGVLGPVLHFAWEWSGENVLVAAFSAVNESIWEHMKILFWPLLLLAAVETPVFARHYRNFFAVKAAAILSAVVLIPVVYYTYSGVWGRHLAAVDIAIYYVAAAFSGWLTCILAGRGRLRGQKKQLLAGVLLGVLAGWFVLFTYAPPDIGLFWAAASCFFGG